MVLFGFMAGGKCVEISCGFGGGGVSFSSPLGLLDLLSAAHLCFLSVGNLWAF